MKNGVRNAVGRPHDGSTSTTASPPNAVPMGIMPHAKNRYTLLTLPKSSSGMIVCRSDTVMTFHSTATSVSTPNITITNGQVEVMPMMMGESTVTDIVTTSE